MTDTARTPMDLGEWTDREMFDGIYEAVVSHATVRTTSAGVVRATCGLCDWKTNPRASATSATGDMISHAVDAHAPLVRKTIRAIQRRAQRVQR